MKRLFALLMLMTLLIPAAQAQTGGEIVLPDVGIALTLPEGFGENVMATRPQYYPNSSAALRSYHVDLYADLYVFPPFDEETMRVLMNKIKDADNRYIWQEGVQYGENRYFIYVNQAFEGWYAFLMTENGFGPWLYITAPTLIAMQPDFAGKMLESVRVTNANAPQKTMPYTLRETADGTEVSFLRQGVALTLPDGFDGILIESDKGTSILEAVHPSTGDEIYVLPSDGEKNTQIILRKVKDKSNGFIYQESVYGTHEFITYTDWMNVEHRAIVTSGANRGMSVSVCSDQPGKPPYADDLLRSLRTIEQ